MEDECKKIRTSSPASLTNSPTKQSTKADLSTKNFQGKMQEVKIPSSEHHGEQGML